MREKLTIYIGECAKNPAIFTAKMKIAYAQNKVTFFPML